VPLVPSHDRSAARRAANYLSFAEAATLRTPVLRGCDAVLAYSSPATATIPTMASRSVHRTPYVLLVPDVWPDSVLESGFLSSARASRVVEASLHRYCDATYRRAHAVAATSPGMAEMLVERGVPADKLHVVPNWVSSSPLEALRTNVVDSANVKGDLFVRKAPASTVQVLAEAVRELFGASSDDIHVIGTRHGEKLYETLVSWEEMSRAQDQGDFYRILVDDRGLNYDMFFKLGAAALKAADEYASHNTDRMDRDAVVRALRELPDVMAELEAAGRTPAGVGS
jgi:hypothetical protein